MPTTVAIGWISIRVTEVEEEGESSIGRISTRRSTIATIIGVPEKSKGNSDYPAAHKLTKLAIHGNISETLYVYRKEGEDFEIF